MNIVLSYTMENEYTVKSIDEAFQRCKDNNTDTVWIIGGGTLYDTFLKDTAVMEKYPVHEIYHTEIRENYYCDRFIKPIWREQPELWEKKSEIVLQENETKLAFIVYTNKKFISSGENGQQEKEEKEEKEEKDVL